MDTQRKLNTHIIPILVLVIAGSVAYLNALHAGFLSLDDLDTFRVLQSSDHSLGSLLSSGGGYYFRPLVIISFILDLSLFGQNPAGLHAVNVLIHIVNGLLLYYLAWEVLPSETEREPYALSAALLFVVHPVNSEAVIWISARTDLLCCSFFLLTLILMVQQGDKPGPLTIAGLFVTFFLSLLAKEASFALVVAAPLWSVFQIRKNKTTVKNAVLINLSLFFAAALYIYLRSGMGDGMDAGISKILAISQPTSSLLIDSLSAYGFYLQKLLYPFPLNFAITEINSTAGIVAFGIGIITAVLLLRDEGAFLPVAILASSLIIPVFAVLGKLPWTLYAERYLYLPMTGFAILVSYVFMTYTKRVPSIVIIAGILLLAGVTINRSALWADHVDFWQDATVKSPRFHRTYVGLADALIAEQRFDEAEPHLAKAAAMGYNGDLLWQSYATIYFMRRDFTNYEKMMVKAAEASPHPVRIYVSLIRTLQMHIPHADSRSSIERSIYYHLKAVERDSSYVDGLYNAGKLYLMIHEEQKAAHYFSLVVQHEGDYLYKPFAERFLKKIHAAQKRRR